MMAPANSKPLTPSRNSFRTQESLKNSGIKIRNTRFMRKAGDSFDGPATPSHKKQNNLSDSNLLSFLREFLPKKRVNSPQSKSSKKLNEEAHVYQASPTKFLCSKLTTT